MPKLLNQMDHATALEQARSDATAKMMRLHALEHERNQLTPGPGYYEAKQKLNEQIETARREYGRAEAHLYTVKNGTQTTLL